MKARDVFRAVLIIVVILLVNGIVIYDVLSRHNDSQQSGRTAVSPTEFLDLTEIGGYSLGTNDWVHIYYDRNSGVMYFDRKEGRYGQRGMSPIYNADGSLKLYDISGGTEG